MEKVVQRTCKPFFFWSSPNFSRKQYLLGCDDLLYFFGLNPISVGNSSSAAEMSGVSFLRLRLQSCSRITKSYSNPAPVYAKNQNSNSCFHSCYSEYFWFFTNFTITKLFKLCKFPVNKLNELKVVSENVGLVSQ